jgi:hypothetical protein
LAFADDTDIIGRTQKSMKASLNLERAAQKMNLQINQNKVYASNKE